MHAFILCSLGQFGKLDVKDSSVLCKDEPHVGICIRDLCTSHCLQRWLLITRDSRTQQRARWVFASSDVGLPKYRDRHRLGGREWQWVRKRDEGRGPELTAAMAKVPAHQNQRVRLSMTGCV